MSTKLPPTDRDFDIYEAVQLANLSTWSQAEKHGISQTRVRQIVRRVVEWIAEVLPPQSKVAQHREVCLARQLAADRFQHQLEEITTLWQRSHETKHAGVRIRLTTAQARLGVVSGLVGGLVADALEGLPVPTWDDEAWAAAALDRSESAETTEPNGADSSDSDAPAYEPLHPDLSPENAAYLDQFRTGPGPLQLTKAQLKRIIREAPGYFSIMNARHVTPDIIAFREAVGDPLPKVFLDYVYDNGYLPRPGSHVVSANAAAGGCVESAPADETHHAQSASDETAGDQNPKSQIQNRKSAPPPPGDCSQSVPETPLAECSNAQRVATSGAAADTCDAPVDLHPPAPTALSSPSCPLLTPDSQPPVLQVDVTPKNSGAAVTTSVERGNVQNPVKRTESCNSPLGMVESDLLDLLEKSASTKLHP